MVIIEHNEITERLPNFGGPKYRLIDGFDHKFTADVPEAIITSAMKYVPRDDDVFIMTYLKNGTTWTQQIMTLMFNDGKVPDEVTTEGLYIRSPFLELQGAEQVEKTQRPCAIKSHLPRHLQPWSNSAKYVVMIRDPRDVAVSYYHHVKLFESFEFKERSFDDFFEYFIAGDIESGDYFDWYLGWWQDREASNIHFLTYEAMKRSPEQEIAKLAKFMSDELHNKITANDGEILKRVIENSSVNFMRETTNRTLAKTFQFENFEQFTFVRNGEVGEGKTMLNESQMKRIEDKIKVKFGNTGLYKIWD